MFFVVLFDVFIFHKSVLHQDVSYILPRCGVLVRIKVVFPSFCQDIGGCDIQKQEIREAVELPLTHHELYKQIGIDPPRGVLLYGPPGTGKTMLAKAVANHTTAAFIRVVGSEFVQKYLGEVSKDLMRPLLVCRLSVYLCLYILTNVCCGYYVAFIRSRT